MKSCSEITNELLERRENYNTDRKNKINKFAKISVSVCGVCLIACISFGLIHEGKIGDLLPFPENPSTVENTGLDGETVNDGDLDLNIGIPDDVKNNDAVKFLCFVNKIEDTLSAAPKYLDPALHYTETWSDEDAVAYLGIDLNTITVESVHLKAKCDVLESDSHTVYFTNDGTLVRDIMSFECELQGEKISVSASKLGLPYDCLYTTSSEKITTYIGTEYGNVGVLFYGTSEINIESEPLLRDFIVADFQVNGVNFRVSAENIYQRDFYHFISAIVNQ